MDKPIQTLSCYAICLSSRSDTSKKGTKYAMHKFWLDSDEVTDFIDFSGQKLSDRLVTDFGTAVSGKLKKGLLKYEASFKYGKPQLVYKDFEVEL